MLVNNVDDKLLSGNFQYRHPTKGVNAAPSEGISLLNISVMLWTNILKMKKLYF